jgi:hypothetical protein
MFRMLVTPLAAHCAMKLQAQEALLFGDEDLAMNEPPTPKKAKKDKKDKKAAPAANEMAALAAAMADGEDIDFSAGDVNYWCC